MRFRRLPPVHLMIRVRSCEDFDFDCSSVLEGRCKMGPSPALVGLELYPDRLMHSLCPRPIRNTQHGSAQPCWTRGRRKSDGFPWTRVTFFDCLILHVICAHLLRTGKFGRSLVQASFETVNVLTVVGCIVAAKRGLAECIWAHGSLSLESLRLNASLEKISSWLRFFDTQRVVILFPNYSSIGNIMMLDTNHLSWDRSLRVM